MSTTDPITCTWDEAATLDRAEAIMIGDWSVMLAAGARPGFILALIERAVDFDPRLGLHMDNCTRHGCPVLVDEAHRDEHGRLYCTQGCADADAEDLHERTVAWGLANGYVRPASPGGRAAA